MSIGTSTTLRKHLKLMRWQMPLGKAAPDSAVGTHVVVIADQTVDPGARRCYSLRAGVTVEILCLRSWVGVCHGAFCSWVGALPRIA